MTPLEWCFVLVFGYIVVQLVSACCLRIYGNDILISPRIRSKKSLKGYYAIVTGSNQGIGYEVAMYLVNHGAHVVLACRSNERGYKAQTSINNQVKSNAVYKGGKAEYVQCDLSRLDSTKTFIETYKNKQYPLHLLINNAGIKLLSNKAKFTCDGIDMTLQINYLSHFLITHQLLPLMIESNKDKQFDCRIINTASLWHNYGYLDFTALTGDKQTQRKRYKGGKAMYGTTKLAQIMHAIYLQTEVLTKLNAAVSICSVHPGGVRTNIFKTGEWSIINKLGLLLYYPAWFWGMRNNEEGSRNIIYCAVAPIGKQTKPWGGEYIPGAYHVNMKPHITSDTAGQSTNPKVMKRLYEYSLDILKLKRRTKQDYKRLMNIHEDEDKAKCDTFKALKDGIIVLSDKAYWFYSLLDTNWSKISDLNESQRCFDGPSILMNDNTVYRIGGRNITSDQCMKHCEYLRLDTSMNSNQWITMNGAINERRCSAASIFLGQHLLLIGGDDNGDELSSMEEYDFEGMKWNLRASMNENRNDFGVCSINTNELMVVGGHSVDVNTGISGFLDTIEKYNYDLDEWVLLNVKLPFGKRARCGAFHWKQCKPNTIIIAGGTSPARNIVQGLDLEKMQWIKYPKLNNGHWWPQIGTLSSQSPHILYVVGQNEKNELNVIEYIDVRQNSMKWETGKIIKNHEINKIIASYWL